jgi:hypothetical protein
VSSRPMLYTEVNWTDTMSCYQAEKERELAKDANPAGNRRQRRAWAKKHGKPMPPKEGQP